MTLTLEDVLGLPVGAQFTISNPCPECTQDKLMAVIVLRGDCSPRTWHGDSGRTKNTISTWRGLRVICAGCGWTGDSHLRRSE